MTIQFIGILIGIAVFGLVTIGFVMTKMFQRASKEQSFVRTGFGGQRVVKDGGAIVFPIFHEIIPINMQTLRLGVERKAKDSLITKDRLRVDVKAEFYVRVAPDTESIASAAQTLGRRTLAPDQLAALIEGKFVDALRAAAAGMDMQDLHEKRGEFVQKVQNTVAEDLRKNGLELESVSLTGLDQTSVEHFNPNNAFDAEGLAKLTLVTQTRAKERNDVEADARVAIETKNLEANKKSLELRQENEFATLEQERLVETRRAEQEADLAKQRAEREREAETARILAAQATEQARVEKERAIKVAETEAAQALEIANQASRIAIAEKSKKESESRAAADSARAEAVRAAEAVKTVEAEAQAIRSKKVAVIAAEQAAEQDATRIRVMADAELAAADKQAQARERLIEADAKRYEVEAEGTRKLNEAANIVSQSTMEFNLRKSFIEALPEVLSQMAKPMEKIDSIRIVNMGGFQNEKDGVAQSGNLTSDLTDSMLKYRLQVPVIDEMARELGIDLNRGLNGVVAGAVVPKTVIAPATEDETANLRKLAGIE